MFLKSLGFFRFPGINIAIHVQKGNDDVQNDTRLLYILTSGSRSVTNDRQPVEGHRNHTRRYKKRSNVVSAFIWSRIAMKYIKNFFVSYVKARERSVARQLLTHYNHLLDDEVRRNIQEQLRDK
jgi:hypothetical protein